MKINTQITIRYYRIHLTRYMYSVDTKMMNEKEMQRRKLWPMSKALHS